MDVHDDTYNCQCYTSLYTVLSPGCVTTGKGKTTLPLNDLVNLMNIDICKNMT